MKTEKSNACGPATGVQLDCQGNEIKKPTQLEQALEKQMPKYKGLDEYGNPATVRRKKIYKGRVAPQGTLYLEVRVKTKTGFAVSVRHILGNLGENVEKWIAEEIRHNLALKHNV